ncbi:MAG: hypothetical protein ACOVLI_10700 [Rhabdaerophilum sp.]
MGSNASLHGRGWLLVPASSGPRLALEQDRALRWNKTARAFFTSR